MSEHEIDILFNLLKVYEPQRLRVRNILDAIKDEDIQLICFGSSVQGTATPFSDLDLCVKTRERNIEYFDNLRNIIAHAYWDFDLPNNEMDVLYYNILKEPNDVKDSIDSVGVILKDFKEGYG